MPKRKKKRAPSSTGASTPSDPRQQGMKAFHAGSFGAAIMAWSYLPQDDPKVCEALAEAHFRRFLTQASSAKQLEDIQRAVELVPTDLRYRYHLGLTLHRTGNLDAAIECYHTVLTQNASWPGVALVLALAMLERDPQADIAALVNTTTTIHSELKPVQQLLRGDISLAPPADSPDGAIDTFWHGLSLIQHGDGSASEVLNDDRQLPSPQAVAIRRYYKGVAAAQHDDMETAMRHWQRAAEQVTSIHPWLRDNMITILTQRLARQIEVDDLPAAKESVQIALKLQLNNNALNDLIVYALDRIAHTAAAEGKWQSAVAHWEDARQVVSNSSSLGTPRPLLHNLALGYEHMEQWGNAAEMWRAMLRTRPRKTSKAGGPTDEQWSWVRKRVIECYKRAGTPDDAVSIFRQAIKADPEDLDMRIQLSDALLANDQEQAAFNELQRILQIAPDYVDAHLRTAELYHAWGQWWAAERSLRRVLHLQPDRDDVRRQVSRMMLSRGNNLHNRGLYKDARKVFEEGQALAPDDYQFPLNLARVSIDEHSYDQAEQLLNRALELGSDMPEAYAAAIECWAVANKIDNAHAVLARAEANLPAAPEMYLLIGLTLLQRATPPPEMPIDLFGPQPPSRRTVATDPVWMEMANQTLDKAINLRPDDPKLRVAVAEQLKLVNPELALRYAQEAVESMPDDANVLILLGLIQALNSHDREAKETLRRASRLARKQGDQELVEQANALRQQVGSPFLHISIQMAETFGGLDLDDSDPYFDMLP